MQGPCLCNLSDSETMQLMCLMCSLHLQRVIYSSLSSSQWSLYGWPCYLAMPVVDDVQSRVCVALSSRGNTQTRQQATISLVRPYSPHPHTYAFVPHDTFTHSYQHIPARPHPTHRQCTGNGAVWVYHMFTEGMCKLNNVRMFRR